MDEPHRKPKAHAKYVQMLLESRSSFDDSVASVDDRHRRSQVFSNLRQS